MPRAPYDPDNYIHRQFNRSVEPDWRTLKSEGPDLKTHTLVRDFNGNVYHKPIKEKM